MKNTQERMTTSHSKMVEDFKGWLEKWNRDIVTQDDIENQEMIRGKLQNAFAQIEFFLNKSDQKVMIKARGDLAPGSDEANKKEVLAMFENQKKDWYKNFKKISLDVSYVGCIIDNIYEIKNRRSYECFSLRAENSKLRAELEKLRNEKK